MGLMMAATPAFAMEYGGGVPGEEVGRLIRVAMEEAGQAVPDFADPARAFPPCASRPEVLPRQGSWATAEVRCDGPVWSRAVRTGAVIGAAAMAAPDMETDDGPMAVVLLRSVARGAVLMAEDVALAPAGARSPDGIFTDPGEVIGRRTKTALGAGKPVLLRQLEPVWMVARGNPVVLVAMAGGLAVSAPAEALDDGGMGDVIRVLNKSSGREVKAVVTGRNSVMAQTNMR
ncbi:MAG: flagellar basal body P-ring formation protein FlgA [Rhodobacteraceae bacterium]|nr:flagellar basal body P-ring formation protein FlgA [Paracoccaceae bacterium]